MIPSSYQQAIYDWVQDASGSAIVNAVAGSGKTYTLGQVCQLIPSSQSVRVFAFNKPIADVFKGKVSHLRHVQVSTYHSAGYQAILRELHAKVDTDRNKSKDLIKELLDDQERRAYGDPLMKLLGVAKGVGMGVLCTDASQAWADLIEHHDLEFEYLIPPGVKSDAAFQAVMDAEQAHVITLAQDLLQASNRAALEPFAWRIDFDDQLYLPILWDLALPQYDWVLVDEAQDTNAIQRALIRKSLKPGGRVLAVGDRNQSIYQWRGASQDALDLIGRDFDAQELPLSVCYRCATSIVDKAKTLVPQIEAAPDAKPGMVLDLAHVDYLSTLVASDAILCRNNAPLVKKAHELIAKGIGCRVIGRDIGDGLKRLIWKLHAKDLDDLETRLLDYETREVKRYRKLGQDAKAAGVQDRTQCIFTMLEGLQEDDRSIDGLTNAIDRLFGDPQAGLLTLSTIHKAKGQEWGTVAIIRSDLLPSSYATKPWQLQQERNLQYVAWTRAKETLLIVDDAPEWVKKKRRKETGEEVGA